MRHPFFKGVVLGSTTAMLVLVAGTAFAGSGIGGVFNLGVINKVDNRTLLRGTIPGRVLQLSNLGTGTALDLRVQPGAPPMKVNSTTQVANLNADQLDGVDSTGFMQGTAVQSRLDEPADSANRTILTVPGFGTVEGSCDPTNGYRIFWRNSSGGTQDVWSTAGGTTTYATPANASGTYPSFDSKTNQLIPVVVGSVSGHTVTVHTTAHWTAGGCLFHAQAVAQ